MEEPKAPEAAPKLSDPPSTVPQTQTPLPPTTKKRPRDSDAHSNYFKIRAVTRDLRPHFIQVLQTPDYKNCKASHEIQEQLKIVIKLYDNVKADVVSLGKSKNMQDGQNLDKKTGQEQQSQHVKSSVEKAFARSSEIKHTPPVHGLQKLHAEDGQAQGTYIVGGSAFGWNFITFLGKEPVYYGRTKEQFRSAKVAE
ncbi:uncharacterized protein LOC133314151 [Gastrolobium bilobum]|uniref:uncharacterized protein LOC133314151 n=1 Tax=Gastrolobium bilobum TaxID=150636 RepID=UPI002AB0BECC|nr:uncharacterized protein LOC133314151 [Gastrolobium bilobum]